MKLGKKGVIEKVINYLLNILIFMFSIFLLISVYIGFQTRIIGNDYANFFGYSLFEVQTGSMEKAINVGDWIIVKLTSKVEVNDIIAYVSNGDYITHRVVEKYKGTYITKGDANPTKDDPIEQSQIIGKVVKVLGGLGIIRNTFFNPAVLLSFIITLFIFSIAFKQSKISFKEIGEKYLLGFEALKKKIKGFIKGKKEISNYKEFKQSKKEKLELELELEEEEPNFEVNKDEKIDQKLEEELGKTSLYRVVSVEDEEINDKFKDLFKTKTEAKLEEELEEELGKTSLYRIVSVDSKGVDQKYKNMELKTEDVIKTKKSPKMEKYAELEDELGKTSVFRVVSVDAEEVNKKDVSKDEPTEESESELEKTSCYQFISVDPSEVDKTLLEIAENEMKNPKEIEGSAIKTETESKMEEEIEEIERLTSINLEMLKSKINRKGKNIIDKILLIKQEEINKLIELITMDDSNYIYRATIKNKLTTVYTDAKYYDYYGEDEVSKRGRNVTSRLKAIIKIRGERLINEYSGKNDQYESIVKRYIQLFTLIADLEQARDSITDIKAKREYYQKVLQEYLKKVDSLKVESLTKKIMGVQKQYLETIDFFLKQLETNMFDLKLNPITGIKNMFGLKIDHNINFSKLYSDYIIDKTYSEGIIAEDKISVMLSLLSGQLVNDIMKSDYGRKYVFHIPSSLYSKQRKLGSLLKIIDNEYAKSNLIILVTYETLLNYKQLIKDYRKMGYKFGLAFNKNDVMLKKHRPYLYIVNCYFINKKEEAMKTILAGFPKDLSDKIIYDDLSLKVGDIGGE